MMTEEPGFDQILSTNQVLKLSTNRTTEEIEAQLTAMRCYVKSLLLLKILNLCLSVWIKWKKLKNQMKCFKKYFWFAKRTNKKGWNN